MYRITSLFLVFFILLACNDSKKKQEKVVEDLSVTTYYLIRHAEKDRSDPTNKNPQLTEEGLLRARNWAAYFENIPIDHIFSTDYSRTMQTAAYTATQKDMTIESYNPNALYDDRFREHTQGKSVLVVGHSDTTPQFVNAIIAEKKYDDIADNENGLLYKVTLKEGIKNVEIISVR
ncbi:MAG: SixA phosphatase family protein [Flavobacteriales bacterium]